MKPLIYTLICSSLLTTCAVEAAAKDKMVRVTITNMTAGQRFSKPVVISHEQSFHLFQAGQAASAELAGLAQDGAATELAASLIGATGVLQAAVGEAGITAGQTESVDVMVNAKVNYISVAAMLADSNDAFLALDGVGIPKAVNDKQVSFAIAYDAGAEDNDESCLYIPAPPCGHPHAQSTVAGEGYVYVHAGIRGSGDLPQKEYDWQNPVAKIVIERLP